MSCISLILWRHSSSCVPLQVFRWQLFSQQPPVFRVGRCAVVRTWQGQTWNPGLRPSWRSQKGPIALPYCLSTVSHYYPSTTNNLVHQAPGTTLPSLDWLAGYEPPPVPKSCTPSHELLITPLYHSSAQQGRTRWAPVSQTERCRLGCWTVSATEPVLHSPSAHKQQSDGERGRERDRAQKTQQKFTSSSTETSAPQGYVSYVIFSSPPLPRVHCHPIGGHLLDLSHHFQTHFLQMKWVGLHCFHYCVIFLYFSMHIYKKKKNADNFSQLLINT